MNKTIFLWVYLVVWLWHGTTTLNIAAETFVYSGIGFGLAWIAHRRAGYLTLFFLLSHMVIEWFDLGRHWASSKTCQLVLFGIHSLMDLSFLWSQLPSRCGNSRWIGLLGVLGLAVLVFSLAPEHHPTAAMGMHKHGHNHTSAVSLMVWGGVLGCIAWHLGKRHRVGELK